MGFINSRDQGGLTAVRRAAFLLFYVTEWHIALPRRSSKIETISHTRGKLFTADEPESSHCVPLSLTNWLTRSLIG